VSADFKSSYCLRRADVAPGDIGLGEFIQLEGSLPTGMGTPSNAISAIRHCCELRMMAPWSVTWGTVESLSGLSTLDGGG
jgi:hypothetical protein